MMQEDYLDGFVFEVILSLSYRESASYVSIDEFFDEAMDEAMRYLSGIVVREGYYTVTERGGRPARQRPRFRIRIPATKSPDAVAKVMRIALKTLSEILNIKRGDYKIDLYSHAGYL